jgi:SNF2 family DNA or RNA helicase
MTKIPITNLYTQAAMARAIPDSEYDRERREWVMELDEVTPRSAAVALKLFPELAVDWPQLIEIQERLIQDVRPFDNATPFNTEVSPNVVQDLMEAEGKTYYEFQTLDLGYLEAVLQEHGGAYLGWERGMGKTIGALSLLAATGSRDALIVAPNSAKGTVWYPEVEKYFGTTHEIFMLPNQKVKRERTMAEVKRVKEEGEYGVILIVHYEALAIIGLKSGRGWDKYGRWDLVIADEVHRIKNIKAKMTRALKKIGTRMKLGLSGSIIQNSVDELFSPLQWLFPKHYKSKWRDWNDRFLDYVEGGYAKICVGVLPNMLETLRRELGVFMVYRRKEDELDMPERVDEDVHIELSPGQRKAYDELVAGCLAQLEDETFIVADEGLPMLSKLRQIATGLDLVGNVEDSAKLDHAKELIEDNPDEQFVVFSWFKASCDALCERVGEGVVVHGDVPQHKRDALIEEFTSGQQRILYCTIATMGESQNFQNANNVIFIDRSWNPSDNTQAEDRVYRLGQENKVTITHIIAKGTVDEHRVSPVLMNKDVLRRIILGG